MSAAIMSEDLLIFLGYCLDQAMRPTFHKWDRSYEGWLYRNGFLRRVQYLEAQNFLRRERAGDEWVWRLTQLGRERAREERDPQQHWQRSWDGWWRQIIFDLPVAQQHARSSLVRWLRHQGFGYLQDSVWISPDPIRDVAKALNRYRNDAASFTILECHCARGFTNDSLVKGAWPFDRINSSYRAYAAFVKAQLRTIRRAHFHPRELFALLHEERKLWRDALALDPLLPQVLLPSDYAGRRAWRLRQKLLTRLASRALPA